MTFLVARPRRFPSAVRILATALTAVVMLTALPGPAHAVSPPADVMWFNPTSGEVSTWIHNGSGTVLGKQALDWHCDLASGCANHWGTVGAGDLNNDGTQDLMWWNTFTGELSTWLTNGNGVVLGTQSLSWRCSLANAACQWQPVGIADVDNDGNQDLMWYENETGELSTWLLNGNGSVIGTQSLNWRCGHNTGCAGEWSPVGLGDLNNDGGQDLMWYNPHAGVLSSWLLNGTGWVLGTQNLDWHCDYSSGCAYVWRPIGIGDHNADGTQDLTWYNDQSGEVSSWLLNGSGTVVWAQALDWRCDYASGCSQAWAIVDLVD